MILNVLRRNTGDVARYALCICKRSPKTVSNSSRSFHQGRSNKTGSCRVSISAVNLNLTRSKQLLSFETDLCKASQRSFRTSNALWDDVRTVVVPPFADSITEGDVRWGKVVGATVVEDEVIANIETDKTSIPVPSPGAGIIEELLVADGTTVKPGTPLFKIKITGGGGKKADAPAAAKAAPSAAPPPPPPPEPKPAAATTPIPSTPPPPPPRPSEPKASVPAAAVKPQPAAAPPRAPAPPPPKGVDITTKITGSRTEQRVKMNRMRQRIAERLKEAQNTNAMLTTFNEVDMSNIVELRKTHGEAFAKKHNFKLSFMSPFVKACAYALVDAPVVNAVIEGQDIVYRDYVDISVAVATPKGLVVPVMRNCENMNYVDVERGMAQLAEKARKNQLAIEDMDGGTFTISNGGVFGSMFGTPIINPPQSAILGMHGIFERPVVVKGQIVIRPMMYVALTYDHRLIDGREAVTFLRKIKSAVEDPRTILLDL